MYPSIAVRLPVIVWMIGCLNGWLIDSLIDHTLTHTPTQEVGHKSNQIEQLEREKAQLIQKMFNSEHRAVSLDDTTFIWLYWILHGRCRYILRMRATCLFTSSATVLFSWVEILYERTRSGSHEIDIDVF